MTDHDMKKLKDLPTPMPRAGARKAALGAAMAEFDSQHELENGPESISRDGFSDLLRVRPKGNGRLGRHSNASYQNRRISGMRLTSKYAIAASIAAVAIAVPGALYYLNEDEIFVPSASLRGNSPQPRSSIELAGVKDANVSVPKSEAPKADLRASGKRVKRKRKPVKTLRKARPAKLAARTQTASGGLMQPPAGLGAVGVDSNRPVVAFDSMGGAYGRFQTAKANSPRVARERVQRVPETLVLGEILKGEQQEYRDRFETVASNPVKQVSSDPVSTFSIDVDTASYSFVRRALNAGQLPPKASVRVEELVNYFPYDYGTPESAEVPFKIDVNVVPSPWRPANRLVHVSVKGYELNAAERPRANLVFLIDVSGSMGSRDKLPLVLNALRMLVNELKPDDTIGIVTYASGSGVALQPTKVRDKAKILAAINSFRSGGSTAGAQGISDAYRLAEANFDPEGVNRIILATDGDFNVGVTDGDDLQGYIERKRKAGVFLSILGVGQGNYNDALMQILAQNGNGTASYIDTLNEARKVLVDEASSTLFTIAKDVKIQVEFNPKRVRSYRLIGYETRALKREDFNNDRVDAGDVGSGHSVTAIYEITPVGAPGAVDDLRYAKAEPARATPAGQDGELGFFKLRYKLPKEDVSKLLTQTIASARESDGLQSVPDDVRFAIAVAAFGQVLRGSSHVGEFGFDEIVELARGAKGDDPFGYRAEFINLVRLAKSAQP